MADLESRYERSNFLRELGNALHDLKPVLGVVPREVATVLNQNIRKMLLQIEKDEGWERVDEFHRRRYRTNEFERNCLPSRDWVGDLECAMSLFPVRDYLVRSMVYHIEPYNQWEVHVGYNDKRYMWKSACSATLPAALCLAWVYLAEQSNNAMMGASVVPDDSE